MRCVNSNGKFVAMISKQNKLCQGFEPGAPWLLLYNTGRTDRFASLREAREEAIKSWPAVKFSHEGTCDADQ